MPFINESGSPDVEYLSDGMTETLIGSLTQLPNLSVKARSSVFRYKGKEVDAKLVGTWLAGGTPFVTFNANGTGQMEEDKVKWTADGSSLTVTDSDFETIEEEMRKSLARSR